MSARCVVAWWNLMFAFRYDFFFSFRSARAHFLSITLAISLFHCFYSIRTDIVFDDSTIRFGCLECILLGFAPKQLPFLFLLHTIKRINSTSWIFRIWIAGATPFVLFCTIGRICNLYEVCLCAANSGNVFKHVIFTFPLIWFEPLYIYIFCQHLVMTSYVVAVSALAANVFRLSKEI